MAEITVREALLQAMKEEMHRDEKVFIMGEEVSLFENKLSGEYTAKKMKALRSVGVPYTDEDIAGAKHAVEGKTEIDALVVYLQQLGTLLTHKR